MNEQFFYFFLSQQAEIVDNGVIVCITCALKLAPR